MVSLNKSHYPIFWFLAGVGAGMDLVTKWLAFALVGEPPATLSIWPGVFSLTTSYNKGALWGLGHGFEHANYVFAALSIAAATAILFWIFWHGAGRERLLSAALGLIMAGTLGNCFDRLVYKQVRDFLYFELIDWPIFNVADSFLVCGAGLLMLQAFFAELPTDQAVNVGGVGASERNAEPNC